jgi:hypothetical protein
MTPTPTTDIVARYDDLTGRSLNPHTGRLNTKTLYKVNTRVELKSYRIKGQSSPDKSRGERGVVGVERGGETHAATARVSP